MNGHRSPSRYMAFGYYSNTVDARESKQIENTSNLVSGNLRHIVALMWSGKIGKQCSVP